MKSPILIREPESDEDRRLWNRFLETSKRVNDPKAGADGSGAYSVAYQALVKAGLAQQIKRKFR